MHLRLTFLAVCLALATGLPQVPNLHRRKPIPIGIVGGDEATPGEFPYQISMQISGIYGWSHYCGGSVYNENYVITAAHCTKDRTAAKVMVVAGEYDTTVESGDEQVIDVEALIVHEDYDVYSMENDISLIKLSKALVMNDLVKAIEIPAQMELVEAGTVCTTTGWGATTEGGVLADKLRKVDVPVITDDSCRWSYDYDDIADSMLCAGLLEGGKDACQGDSGGPFVCGGKLHGIVSWGYGCARPDRPGVYTEVAYFREWVEANAV